LILCCSSLIRIVIIRLLVVVTHCVVFYIILLLGALFSLKRKKLYEVELDKIGNIKMTLETQVMNLESAAQNAETFKAMQAGKVAMSNIRKDTDISKVDELMDDIKEEMDMASEISGALAQPIDPLMTDDDELLAELELLGANDVDEQLLSRPSAAATASTDMTSFPNVPNQKMPTIAASNNSAATSKKEAEELALLEAELAGMMS
jgi:charged multivesicular body protein 4